MEVGLARPPSPSYTAITPISKAPDKNEPTVKTELPARQTVTPSSENNESRRATDNPLNREPSRESQPRLERRNVIDPESESVIYVATNSDTGEVVRQIPSETLRKLRAYAKTISDQSTALTSQSVVRTA